MLMGKGEESGGRDKVEREGGREGGRQEGWEEWETGVAKWEGKSWLSIAHALILS
jgi:hypothetical protein